jgi:hypothetical protein
LDRATALGRDGTLQGTLHAPPGAPADQDWVRVLRPAGDLRADVELSAVAGVDLTLEAWYGDGTLALRVDQPGVSLGETLPGFRPRDEVFWLAVRASAREDAPPVLGNAGQPWRLAVRWRPGWEGEEQEPNDDRATSVMLLPQGRAVGLIGWPGDEDWWTVIPMADRDLEVRLENPTQARLMFFWMEEDGTVREERVAARAGGQARLVVPAGGAAPVAVLVAGLDGTFDPEWVYGLESSPLERPHQDDLDPALEAPMEGSGAVQEAEAEEREPAPRRRRPLRRPAEAR